MTIQSVSGRNKSIILLPRMAETSFMLFMLTRLSVINEPKQ